MGPRLDEGPHPRRITMSSAATSWPCGRPAWRSASASRPCSFTPDAGFRFWTLICPPPCCGQTGRGAARTRSSPSVTSSGPQPHAPTSTSSNPTTGSTRAPPELPGHGHADSSAVGDSRAFLSERPRAPGFTRGGRGYRGHMRAPPNKPSGSRTVQVPVVTRAVPRSALEQRLEGVGPRQRTAQCSELSPPRVVIAVGPGDHRGTQVKIGTL